MKLCLGKTKMGFIISINYVHFCLILDVKAESVYCVLLVTYTPFSLEWRRLVSGKGVKVEGQAPAAHH